MHRLRRSLLLRTMMALDLAAVASALVAAIWWTRGSPAGGWWSATVRLGDGVLLAGWLAATHVSFRQARLYRSCRLGEQEDMHRRTGAVVVLAALALGVGAGWATAAAFAVAAWTAVAGSRAAVHRLLASMRRRGRNLRHILIIGVGPRARRLAAALENRLELGCRVVGFIDEGPLTAWAGERLLGGFTDLDRVLRERPVDEMVVALPLKTFYAEVARIVALGEDRGVVVRVAGDLFAARRARVESEQVEDLSLLTMFTGRGSALAHALKRGADVTAAAAGLAALAPVLALVAMAIKLDSAGPVLFGQVRLGQNGRRFRMWKFRTMIVDAELHQPEIEDRNEVRGAAFKIRLDPRVTRVGRWLRRTSLDELPQLVNVLRGEMSLVGPRPLPLRDVERMSEDWQQRRFSVRPGLTGLWQSSGRHQIAFDDWMRLDLAYIDNWSLLLDLKILLRTVPAVWSGAGAS